MLTSILAGTATFALVQTGARQSAPAAMTGLTEQQLTMRPLHIGGTSSRVSEQNTLDARHNGTVHYEGPAVVETHKEGGQLIVMNRNGSLVIKDEKGRDRERYSIPYGARLKVKDGQKVEQGQILVEVQRETTKTKDIDDLDLDREIEYAFDTDEPMLGRPPAGDVE